MKKYFQAFYYIWSALSVVLLVGLIVVLYCFEKPKTVGYEYFDDISIDTTSDNVANDTVIPIIEMNICWSDTNPDLSLAEMIITEYTDYEQQDYKRWVVQAVGDFNVKYYTKSESKNPQSYGVVDFYFYEVDSTGDIIKHDYSTLNKELDSLDVTAGGEAYQLEVGGANAKRSYTYLYNERIKFTPIIVSKSKTSYVEYNTYDLFAVLFNHFNTKENFEGSKLFNNLNLDEYFTITKGNDKNQFYKLSSFDKNNAYFNVKYSSKNISSYLTAEHSLIGRIANDPNFGSGVVNTIKPAYATNVEHTLNEYVLTKKYDSTINKYVLTISDGYKNYLLSLNNLNVVINVDIENITSVDVCGIDLNDFNKLNLVGLNITSEETKNFYILGSVKTIKDYSFSETLTVLNSEGGVWHE